MSDNTGASTTFAGDSNPHSDRDAKMAAGMGILLALVAFPIAAATALGVWMTFTWGKINHRVIWAVVGLYAILLLITGNGPQSVNMYTESWQVIFKAFEEKDTTDITGQIIGAMLLQMPLSFLIGGVLGASWTYWEWIRRPSWVKYDFRLTPYEWFRRRKNISDIQSDKNSPKNGKTMGIDASRGNKIIQTDEEARAHTLCIGSTGSGKTTTLMLMARDIIKRGHGLIFIDLKGSPDVVRILHEYAERYGRGFQHWTMQTPGEAYEGPDEKGPAYYDPLNRGDASRRTNLIMAGRKWSESYYEVLAQDYLQRAFEVAIASPPSNAISSFADIASLFDVKTLRERAKIMELKGNRRHEEIIRQVDDYFNLDGSVKKDAGTVSALKSVEAEIRILTNSTAGAWLRKDPDFDNDINLRSVADNASIVVFSLDSLNYESDANRVGNLIIQDLKTVTSELQTRPSENTLQVYIDEFSAIESENIVGLINKSRSAGVPVTLSTQAIDDLRKESDSFMGRVVANINSFIIHRANDLDDAEEYAKLTGKEKKQTFNQVVEHKSSLIGRFGRGSGTGKGSLIETIDYRVSPETIQELGTGEAIYIAKSPLRIAKVIVVPEDESKIVVDEVARKKNNDQRHANAPVKPSYQSFDSFGDSNPNWDEKEEKKPVEDNKELDDFLPSYDVQSPNKEALNRLFNKDHNSAPLDLNKSEDMYPYDSQLPPEAPLRAPNKQLPTMPPRVIPNAPKLASKPVDMPTRPLSPLPKMPTSLPARPQLPTSPTLPTNNPATDVQTPKGKSPKIGGQWD